MIAGGAALVLVGHGSARHPEAARPILDLAESIRARGLFAETHACFMKQEPRVEGVLGRVAAPFAVVVPVFAGKGHYTDVLIPRALGAKDGVVVTPPVGTHPHLPALLAARARKVAAAGGLDAAAASLLLIAHGSSRPGGSGETPRAIARAIAAQGEFAEVALAFLEQEPRAADWPKLVAGGELIVLPLLVAQGTHASEDILPLFEPDAAGGRKVRLAAGLGAEPELADIIVEMARAALPG